MDVTIKAKVTFGKWVRHHRLELNLDYFKLSMISGIPKHVLEAVEDGKAESLSELQVRGLSNAFRLRPSLVTRRMQGWEA